MKSKTVLGIILVVLGLLFFIENIGGLNASNIISDWWPVLVVVFGLHLFTKKNHSYIISSFIVLIGILLIAQNLNLIRGDFGDIFWPLVIIGIGISFLFPRWGIHSYKYKNSALPDINSVFGSVNRKIDDKYYSGSNISVVFGSAEIDFSDANIEKEAELNVDCTFASIFLFVPANWEIKIVGSPVFGSINDKRRYKEFNENSPVLIIKNNIIFGSLEIKN